MATKTRKPHPSAMKAETPCERCGGEWLRHQLRMDTEAEELPIRAVARFLLHTARAMERQRREARRMTPTPSESASARAALVREAREESREWATFADLAQTMGALVAERETGTIDIAGTADLLHRLATALEAADADTKRQEAFAYKCAEVCWDGNNIDGGDMQEWLTEAGWLVPTEMAAPCDPETCRCAEYDGDFPTTCYRFAARAAEEQTR